MDEKPFAMRLKAMREQAGLTQQALATKAGIPVETIAGLEESLLDANPQSAAALAAALGVDTTCPSGQPRS